MLKKEIGTSFVRQRGTSEIFGVRSFWIRVKFKTNLKGGNMACESEEILGHREVEEWMPIC